MTNDEFLMSKASAAESESARNRVLLATSRLCALGVERLRQRSITITTTRTTTIWLLCIPAALR